MAPAEPARPRPETAAGRTSIDAQDQLAAQIVLATLDHDTVKAIRLINRDPTAAAVALLGNVLALGTDVFGSEQGLREATILALARCELNLPDHDPASGPSATR